VAHDLGVRVAQALLVRREQGLPGARVQSLVLLNGALCPEAYRPRPVQRLLATPLGPWLGPRLPRRLVQRTLAGLFGPHTPPSAALLDDFWALIEAGGGRRVVHAVGRFWQTPPALRDRLVGALQRMNAPLRLINGSLDPNSGEAMVQRWLTLQPEADVVRLSDVGHWPQIEAPAETAEAILAFWRRGGTSGGPAAFSGPETPPGR
jgi:pimeloyl-ACP methyl ester carboxylesterase